MSSLAAKIGTGTAIGALALGLAGVVFSAGDAKQQVVSLGQANIRLDGRVTTLERDVSDIKASLARIDQATDDTRSTVHRLERAHVHSKAGD